MKNVVVLGASGMLGSMVVDVLDRIEGIKTTALIRQDSLLPVLNEIYPKVRWLLAEKHWQSASSLNRLLDGAEWVVNAVGITKPLIRDDDPSDVEAAIRVNSLLPHMLGKAAEKTGCRVLQIATDCVFSGQKGGYLETDPHDALDVYGKTKSLGETRHDHVYHLRCSIIGPEPKDFKFLLEWFRRQPHRAQPKGFVNHSWNGVTTLHFAKVCAAVINGSVSLNRLQHLVPAGALTKSELLHLMAGAFKRPDITINDVSASVPVDRSLATTDPSANKALWNAAGFDAPPSVAQMIEELAAYDYRARLAALAQTR